MRVVEAGWTAQSFGGKSMRKFIKAAVGALLLAAPASPAMADGTSGSVFWQTIIGIITVPMAPTMNLIGPSR
jgi:hypothetical protein